MPNTDSTNINLTAYLGGATSGASVTFDIKAFTGSGFQLPGNTSYPSGPSVAYVASHEISPSADKERVGVFRCDVQKDGVGTSVAIPLLSQNGKFCDIDSGGWEGKVVLYFKLDIIIILIKVLSIDHFRITAIWPGDRIRRPEHPTENEVRRRSCDESV